MDITPTLLEIGFPPIVCTSPVAIPGRTTSELDLSMFSVSSDESQAERPDTRGRAVGEDEDEDEDRVEDVLASLTAAFEKAMDVYGDLQTRGLDTRSFDDTFLRMSQSLPTQQEPRQAAPSAHAAVDVDPNQALLETYSEKLLALLASKLAVAQPL